MEPTLPPALCLQHQRVEGLGILVMRLSELPIGGNFHLKISDRPTETPASAGLFDSNTARSIAMSSSYSLPERLPSKYFGRF